MIDSFSNVPERVSTVLAASNTWSTERSYFPSRKSRVKGTPGACLSVTVCTHPIPATINAAAPMAKKIFVFMRSYSNHINCAGQAIRFATPPLFHAGKGNGPNETPVSRGLDSGVEKRQRIPGRVYQPVFFGYSKKISYLYS